MWAEPNATRLSNNATVTVVPTTFQGNVRPNRAILINSSPYTLTIFANNLIQQITAWSKDVVTIDPNNPGFTVTPTVAIPSSIAYDTSLYTTWVDPSDQISAAYPQSITPNVLPSVPPTSGNLVGLSNALVETAAGTYSLAAGPPVGQSIFVNTFLLSIGSTGSAASISSALIQDGTGKILFGCISQTLDIAVNDTVNMSGFQVGDNKRLDLVVNVGAGSTSIVVLAVVTYSIGITQP